MYCILLRFSLNIANRDVLSLTKIAMTQYKINFLITAIGVLFLAWGKGHYVSGGKTHVLRLQVPPSLIYMFVVCHVCGALYGKRYKCRKYSVFSSTLLITFLYSVFAINT